MSQTFSVYIAGPITVGDSFAHTGRACALAGDLKSRGFYPYVPHWSGVQQIHSPWTYEEWMQFDFFWLAKCDTLFRMKGQSLGADREVVFAQQNLIPVFYEENDGLNLLETWRKLRNK